MRVLVADDDLVSRLAMEDLLRQRGPLELVMAEDGARAWAALNEPGWDLVCLDVRMPPPDGLELAARLRASPALRRVPAMLITSTADRTVLAASARIDLQGFIVKPVNAETAARIARVLAQLEASVLEPAASASARLRIDTGRHARYVAGFLQQLRALADLAAHAVRGDDGARAAFAQKAEAARTAALTLGAPRTEQVIADALEALPTDAAAAERAMRQALYWVARVSDAA